jgi:hypothetical protein
MERWHQTMKNRVLLENYYLPGDLERQIGTFVDYYNNQRYHESLNNFTPADVYFGRDKAILREREKIKKQTIRGPGTPFLSKAVFYYPGISCPKNFRQDRRHRPSDCGCPFA